MQVFEPLTKGRILVVDDDLMIRKMLTDVLVANGFDIDAVIA